MSPHTLRKSLLGSTATAALLITLGAPAAFAQATIDTTLPGVQTIVTSATYTAGSAQDLTATPSATTTNNNVNVNLTTAIAGNDTVTTAINKANNLISATATGNTSTATAVLAFAPTTAGDTAAVGTLQSVAADVTALSTDDTQSVVVDNSVDGTVRTFTGSSLQDNNDTTASATGNSGTSSITADAGLDVTEAAAVQASVSLASGIGAVAADLAVSSSQKIEPSVVSSAVTTALTTTRIESLDGATVTVSNSDQASSTTGNAATNSIASLDTTASITGSTAVANQQSIVAGASVTATTAGSEISSIAGVDSGFAINGLVTDSTVSVASNTQTAAATGSASTQTLTLDASSITGETAAATIADGNVAAGAQLSAQADAVIGNDQSIQDAVPVTATTSANVIGSSVQSTSNVTTSTLEVAGNTQSAAATGVSTSNALSLTSGATMSATGAVASVQAMDGIVSAVTTANGIVNEQNALDLVDSSMLTTGNTVSASGTGASATNAISTTNATNNLSYATNTGGVANGISAGTDQPSVTAGMALVNDQAQTGSVLATATDNQVLTAILGNDALTSTVATDSNTLSASATGNTAGNAINLAFNALTGTISGAGTGTVAGLANDQTLSGSVTARNVGTNGNPVVTSIAGNADSSSVSTSSNVVSALARGNVTTGNNVVVDATNITSGSEAAPTTAIASGALSASGSFIAASTQTSDADILASQLNVAGTVSNTIETQIGANIQNGSTVTTDTNLLSVSGTANTASNAVQLGNAGTAAIAASGVVANYQGTDAAGTVSALIGTTGTDASASFVSSNSGSSATGTLSVSGNNIVNGSTTPVTLTFTTPLTAEEVSILAGAGYTGGVVGGTTAVLPGSTSADFSIFTAVFSAGGSGVNSGDESFTISSFATTATAGTLNGAGVIARLTGTAADILSSTVSVSGNTVVGDVNGNVATNATSATATSVAGLTAAATSITVDGATVAPTNADLATTNVQNNGSPLASDVAASFAIIADDGNIGAITSSTQTVSDNLQQSFATANRATSSVDVTATNTTADTALQSAQVSSGTVATTSDLDVVANAGSATSSLAMDGNRNQSVANGNVVDNTITLDVTNATATGAFDASGAGAGPVTVTANNALASSQTVTAAVSADATTDVYNQDISRTGGAVIDSGDVSFSRNATVAQATGNSGGATGNTLTLGNAGTANMERTGVLLNTQSVTATTVSASVDQDVSVSLTNPTLAPLQASSLSLDGNATTALARSNVITNTLTVGGANIATGVGSDASFVETTGTLTAAYVLGSLQDNAAGVTATTTQSAVEVYMTNAGGNVIDNSTLSLSGNASTATALANTAVNSVSVGATAANVDATAALENNQSNSGVVAANGGSSVSVTATAAGGTNPVGINGTSVLLAGNSSASNAVGNQAQNSLTASGANITSGTTATSAAVNSTTGGALTASAGNLLMSNQDNTNTITSLNNGNYVAINGNAADGTGAAASGSTLSVTGNTTEARATANLVLNSSINLGGASTSSADATGLIVNTQFNSGAGVVNAEASTSTTVSLNGADTAGALNAGSATVQGNSTLALARGNVVQNALSAEGTNVSAGVSPATINSGLSTDTGVLNASFGVFNEQVQQAAVNATSLNAMYAINATSGTGDALNAASASVGGNSINASAFGNVATNSVSLVSLNGTGNDASAAVFNGQGNSGAITAQATGARIGVYSTGGVASAAVGVVGNTISATAVGNFGNSTVTRANR